MKAPPSRVRTSGAALLAFLALLLLQSAPALAGSVYTWVDAKGDLHVTDRLDDVPEPYFSMYVAAEKREREAEARRKELEPIAAQKGEKDQPRPTPAPRAQRLRRSRSGGSTLLVQEAAREKQLRELVTHWRGELNGATQELAAIEAALQEARHNPLLAQTGSMRQKILSLTEQREATLLRVAQARRMLSEDLPDRARREGVSRRIFHADPESRQERPAPKAPRRTSDAEEED